MLHLFYYLLLVALVKGPTCLTAKTVKQCCTGKSPTNPCEFLELSCPSEHVIYKPDVYPTSTTCKNRHLCDGLVTLYPKLRIDIYNCYWKNKCLIDLSSVDKSSPLAELGTDCPSAEWLNVVVKEWKCVSKNVISDICAGNKKQQIDILKLSDKPSGIIRSHEGFPWNYGKDIFHIENSLYTPMCTVTFNGNMESHTDFSRIAVFVDSLDIGDDFNTAYIQNEELQAKTYVYDFKTPYVNISFGFTKTNYNIKGGKGFVLFYKFLRVDEAVSSIKDFQDIIETKQGTYATCVHRHKYFCPYRKACEKNARLFVPVNDPDDFCSYKSVKKLREPKSCSKEKYNACKLRKTALKGRKWSMVISGNFTEKFFTCKWMFKPKGRTTWAITFEKNTFDRRFDNLTVRHSHCETSNVTTLMPQKTPYAIKKRDIVTVEYSRTITTDSDTWLPPITEFKMTFKRTRKRN
ncbi:uncharacterized protein LOC132563483 [Ylistrum balloti]|uniref:uncharacterized protein LOC132563483 n=1 Tax=Ylistrum balloti TaxID=509963 RepID=UPI002905E9CF|nr:uncharacterized protein LOC132563483 [Ylistrum balloti]